MRLDLPNPEDRELVFSDHPPDIESLRHRYQALLLMVVALAIFLAGSGLFFGVGSRPVPGPTIGVMVESVGENKSCGVDPRRAVFLFAPIDLNLADEELLVSLRGIGPKIARRIIEYRQINGNFSGPDALLNVKGIGEKKLARIRGSVTVNSCSD